MGLFLLKGEKPDLILSGINHGSNVSTNILYSGTMSAAIEGALAGVPSVGYSLTDYSEDADFDFSMKVVRLISNKVINEGLKLGTCLNVNIPNVKEDEIKGIKACRQGKAFWDDTFNHRKDPLGKDYYWLTGSFGSREPAPDTDINYLENNYVTIVPTQYDLTCHNSVEELKKMEIIMANWKNKINKIKYGIIAGLTLPVLGFLLDFLLRGEICLFLLFGKYLVKTTICFM